MNHTSVCIRLLTLLISAALLAGCLHWPSGTADSPAFPSGSDAEAEALMKQANAKALLATDAMKLREAIAAYERVVEAQPNHYQALCYLSTYHLLLGDAYTSRKSEKIKHFRKALQLSEKAMMTNPDFRDAVAAGQPIWQAVEQLNANQMEAMLFWTNALFYYYKEGLGPVGQVVQFRWIKRARMVLERMTELNPDWGGGSIYFTWGIYYLAIPESVGGDRKLSAEYFARAIETGPQWLLSHWGRGKYFHVKMGNPEEFKSDLNWVLKQSPEHLADPYPWRVYFINDARIMLNNYDRYF